MDQTVIALGFFDGVHLGHGAVFQKTVERAIALDATPVVFTFDCPPKEVVTGIPVPLINSAEERKDLIARLYGIENVIFAHFDKEFMSMPWDVFVEQLLVKKYHAAHLVAGHDYHFGAKNQGSPELLKQKCAQLHIGCDIIPQVSFDGHKISSTYIRELIQNGDLELAGEYLGHPHSLTQSVEHGFRIGRTIGIPTINLKVPHHVLLPKKGVYITKVYLPCNLSYPAVTNIGTRPTISGSNDVSVETFLINFEGNLYGQSVRLDFYKRIRDEQKFDSLDDLKHQIQKDIDTAKNYF